MTNRLIMQQCINY